MSMPSNWNDAEGWDHYYDSFDSDDLDNRRCWTGFITTNNVASIAAEWLANGGKTVWVPGCGISALPAMLANAGLDVHATDISATAIAYQCVCNNLREEDKQSGFGQLIFEAHDFRESYLESAFDIVFNIKAIQGFTPDTMKLVARTHFTALKPGGQAYFDTQNVQGLDKDDLESCLVEAGFYLPLYRLNLWYRQRLRETGITHVFILGQPMIPMQGEYADNQAKREMETAKLRVITAEYNENVEAEWKSEQERLEPTDRVATVIYGTG